MTLLSDLGKNQLGLNIKRERDRFGSYFVGLKIRSENDHEPPLITGNSSLDIKTKSSSSNTNVINKLWTTVMGKVMSVLKDTPIRGQAAPHMMDKVMDESTGNDECYGCDGIFQKSTEFKNSVETKVDCNTNIQEQREEKEILEEVLEMPSHLSQNKTQTKTQQEVTDSQYAVTVGDRVLVKNVKNLITVIKTANAPIVVICKIYIYNKSYDE